MSARIMRLFYFTYFANVGIVVPYFAPYFASLGLTPLQIGALNSIVPLARPFFGAAWTYPADRLGRRHAATVIASCLTAVAFALYLIPRSFAGLAAVTLFLAVTSAAQLAFVETTTLDRSSRGGDSYGRVRVWGSLGFVASSMGFGALLAWLPIETALPAALAFAVLAASSSLLLPRTAPAPPATRTSLRGFLRRPGVIAFYAATMLMQASHGAYYNFYSIHMEARGHGGPAIGSLWALGVICEMVLLVFSSRWLALAPASGLLTTCFLLAAGRWGLYAVSSSLIVAIPAQALHAFTYAGFHVAAVTATHRIFPEDLRASGQVVFVGITYGIGSVVGSLSAGVLYGPIGPFRLFAVCALIALAGAVLVGRAARRIPGFDAPPGAAA